ncbi:MAG TPA: site-specific integrase [Methylocella sp.]|nr:site-specific integrase [Methylocella sp.]
MPGLKSRITKRTVDAATIPSDGETWLWDTGLKGFFLRIYASGRKVYAVKCRVGGRQRIHTIGVHGSPWTPDEARKSAVEALRRASKGEDPNEEKKAARKALTVADLIDRYLADGPETKPAKRASTWQIDAANLNRHVRPLLGCKVANVVTKADAARAVRDIAVGKTATDQKTGPRGRARVTGGEGTARRTRTTAAAMFAWGGEYGLVSGNPFAAVKLASAPVRERFLTKEEAGNLLDAISDLQAEAACSGTFADALRLLLLTGARKTEILGLRWSEIDNARKLLILPPGRTKAGGNTGERRIPLSAPALEILTRRRAKAEEAWHDEAGGESHTCEFVFPAGRGQGHATGLWRAFVTVCTKAKLSGLRIHDLRHSFASFAIADGASLFLIGKLLGHASARTTERYAHLSSDPLQDAVNKIGDRIIGDNRGAAIAAR